jgi:Dolichyl-phosphate-mannose-protein mannosyltransferase
LVAILVVQAALSLRLVWSNTAFVDEATYLYAGHQELHSLLTHGTLTVPGQNGYYQTYFSGAPILYPILGAIADSIGGLAGARLLSLVFMLCATTLLYWTAARLYDRRAATAAVCAFAILGPTQFLGAFATYDAMALSLMALAAFLVTKSAQQDDNTLTLAFACLAMVFADATKYAVILFDPVIICLAVLASVPGRTWPEARRQGYRALGYSATLGAILLAAGGHTYVTGLMSTTLARASDNSPAMVVFRDSWKWVGAVAVIGALGVMVHLLREGRARTWTSALLAGAVLLVPLEQARIHTTTSLQKHVDFGAWFACIVAGYAIAKIIPVARRRVYLVLVVPVAAAAIAAATTVTVPQANALYDDWNNSTAAVAALRPWVRNVNVLAEDYFIYSYYLGNEVKLQRWSNTWHLDYVDPRSGRLLTGPPAYRDAIEHHYFGTVVLTYGDTSSLDRQIVAAMTAAGSYKRVVHMRYRKSWFDVYHDVRAR